MTDLILIHNSYSPLRILSRRQPRIKEGASHHARRGNNAEAFLIDFDCNLRMEWEVQISNTLCT